ncbi:hypothetical protein ATCR1_21320 [Agrobacterium tumefaciens CCNWGS0286]|uniref:DUF2293 domain-containing protein n=1 Tax=Agrobacterium tumefaciens TaxID=358 RepID=UPI0002334BE9|nr:DUF2293 domain-containing protein [Agrobacterium tumefaciens]EHH03364.1 hypothetical protein ATCR1_21320 [Agrobacterium tumefaciens CCNWGS0286]
MSKRQRRKERRERRNRQWFHQYEVEYFIRREYPRCPEAAVLYYAREICTRPKNWKGVSIEAAVDVTIQNHLRHEFTDYDQMLMVGVHRKDARQRVQPRVRAMMASWKMGAS